MVRHGSLVQMVVLAIAPLGEYLHHLTLNSLRLFQARGVVSLLRSSRIIYHTLPFVLLRWEVYCENE